MNKLLVTGIDIGYHSIKAVVLKLVDERYVLINYKALPISGNILSDNHTVEYQKIVNKLQDLKKTLPWRQNQVAISIPDNAVISKRVQIESSLTGQERECAIHHAFATFTPLPIEELSFDFTQLNQAEELSLSGMTDYQVFATRKEIIHNRMHVFEGAGFKPIILNIQSHSLFHIWYLATLSKKSTETWLLVDIDVTHSTLCAQNSDLSPFYKSIPYGLNKASSQDRQTAIEQLIGGVSSQLQMMQRLTGSEVSGIWLSGEGASADLATSFRSTLKLACDVVDMSPFFRLANKSELSLLPPSFSLAAGLAMSGLQWLGSDHHD
ncbi:hypothetical protein BCU68_02565 [Vibrio sp. 10N.286.49.B3]|uniref:type IV pilus assembly protein PilM n=1 Tax=Vibrio sp. 10N.286.49.B3 TaxID=1880855 RepID=UPI000C843B85|nr:type IV pilus assembly protein PilM [Vibrio sp. 10N.286.49.B3]PMH46279.1 hypothetical protein BCU68_02565 [Vibrio sp. 10N.286.49.B3]